MCVSGWVGGWRGLPPPPGDDLAHMSNCWLTRARTRARLLRDLHLLRARGTAPAHARTPRGGAARRSSNHARPPPGPRIGPPSLCCSQDDLVCLPHKVAASLGNIGPLVLCTRVTNALTFTDPRTLRQGEPPPL